MGFAECSSVVFEETYKVTGFCTNGGQADN